jgi:hypothetical protein
MISRLSSNMGHPGKKLGHTAQIWIIFVNTSGHIFDSPVMKLGQNACLGNCSDEGDGSDERSRAIMALLFKIYLHIDHFKSFNYLFLMLGSP